MINTFLCFLRMVSVSARAWSSSPTLAAWSQTTNFPFADFEKISFKERFLFSSSSLTGFTNRERNFRTEYKIKTRMLVKKIYHLAFVTPCIVYFRTRVDESSFIYDKTQIVKV